MPLLSSKKKQLVLYNRSGISAPFVVKMERYQAYDPHKHAKRMGKVLTAVTKMQSASGFGKRSPRSLLQESTIEVGVRVKRTLVQLGSIRTHTTRILLQKQALRVRSAIVGSIRPQTTRIL